jgi:hypothetical protein
MRHGADYSLTLLWAAAGGPRAVCFVKAAHACTCSREAGKGGLFIGGGGARVRRRAFVSAAGCACISAARTGGFVGLVQTSL